jgi:hypothetical protein
VSSSRSDATLAACLIVSQANHWHEAPFDAALTVDELVIVQNVCRLSFPMLCT